MLMQKEREMIVEYGKKMLSSGLTKGTGGNISIFDRRAGLMAISPSSMDYFSIQPEDVVVMDLEGNVVEGTRKPSVEHAMHAIFYKNREDVNSVVHDHAVACATMAALHWSLPATTYLEALSGGLEVPCSEYATFATPALAESALKAMGNGYACFLANHGFLSCGVDLPFAFNVAEEIELCSEIHLRAKAAGEPVVIPEHKMMELFEMAKAMNYGKK